MLPWALCGRTAQISTSAAHMALHLSKWRMLASFQASLWNGWRDEASPAATGDKEHKRLERRRSFIQSEALGFRGQFVHNAGAPFKLFRSYYLIGCLGARNKASNRS